MIPGYAESVWSGHTGLPDILPGSPFQAVANSFQPDGLDVQAGDRETLWGLGLLYQRSCVSPEITSNRKHTILAAVSNLQVLFMMIQYRTSYQESCHIVLQ